MTTPVDTLIETFADAGASLISFHPDASIHIDRSLQLIHDAGCKVGLVLTPAGLGELQYVIDKVDLILLMSVNPGFGGQSLIPSTLGKLREARKIIDDSGCRSGFRLTGVSTLPIFWRSLRLVLTPLSQVQQFSIMWTIDCD